MASVADKYLRPDNVAVTTPGESDRVARVWIAARLYLNSPPEAPQNWGQIYPNLNDYNSGSMEVSSTFWSLDITDLWRKKEEPEWKHADLSNVASDICFIIPPVIGVEASFPLEQEGFGWRQSKTTGETVRQMVFARRFARSIIGMLAGTDPALTTTDTETTPKWRKRWRNWNRTQWQRFTTFWRCGRVEKTYMLHGRNLGLKTSYRPPWDKFRTWNRSALDPGHPFNIMERLHSNCQKDLHCHQVCMESTSLQDELK